MDIHMYKTLQFSNPTKKSKKKLYYLYLNKIINKCYFLKILYMAKTKKKTKW